MPYVANSSGWILTEIGRQPWVVYGFLKTEDAVSPNLTPNLLWISIVGFTLIYGVLMIVDIFLLKKYAMKVPETVLVEREEENESYWDL